MTEIVKIKILSRADRESNEDMFLLLLDEAIEQLKLSQGEF